MRNGEQKNGGKKSEVEVENARLGDAQSDSGKEEAESERKLQSSRTARARAKSRDCQNYCRSARTLLRKRMRKGHRGSEGSNVRDGKTECECETEHEGRIAREWASQVYNQRHMEREIGRESK